MAIALKTHNEKKFKFSYLVIKSNIIWAAELIAKPSTSINGDN